MAVVAVKSNQVTNADASPRVLNNGSTAGGVVHEFVATVALANGDDIASTYRFMRVRSSDRVSAVKLYCDAVTTCAGDFGLYRTAADGGAVVDADFFASAQSLAAAITTGTEIQHESAVYGVEDIEKPLWSGLGLSTDPGIDYDIALTLTAAAASAGDVSLKVTTVNNG
jgi:hypothetical protein